ncbi:MAG: proton-conducting membrane transporter [Lachnospiraceae bacterium]|nr:proton-conducting membrane transporter [Lachnospiraceae bacterium]
MIGAWLIPVTVLVPLLGAILLMTPLYRKSTLSVRVVTGAFVTATCLLVVAVAMLGEKEIELFELLPDIPVFFRSDKTAVWFAVLTVAMWMTSTLFSFEYMNHERRETRYCVFSLLALAALMGVCFSGNLVTTYLFYEMMTLATFPLVMHEQTKESISAGITYLYYSLAGAFLGLIGVFFLYSFAEERSVAGGVISYAAGGFIRGDLSNNERTALTIAVFFMLIGLGSKVGMYPLHGWLPKAHPVAPAPASALLSGNITKMGILFVIRVVFFSVGPEFLQGTWAQYALLGLALLTVFLGSMLAFREKVFKKRLAYSTVSQTSYVLVGLYLLAPVAAMGAFLHIIFHSITKNLLFLVAGAIIYKTGRTKVAQMKGIGLIMPVTMICFTLGGLALVGIPPFSGFVSKWYLAAGALKTETGPMRFLVPVILIISALLTAGYLITMASDAFFVVEEHEGHGAHGGAKKEETASEKPADADAEAVFSENAAASPAENDEEDEFDVITADSAQKGREASPFMLIPLVVLAAGTLFFGLFPSLLTDWVAQILNSVF